MNLILGFGETGASFVRYLKNRDIPFLIMDSRSDPSGFSQFETLDKENLLLGKFDENILNEVERVLVSPGIEFENKVLVEARRLGIQILTDIEIFLKETSSKTILVTGTNAKTSVVSMAGHLLKKVYGEGEIVCSGNIGRPVLDTISFSNSISIVELSSFHLELSEFISSDIAVLLNIDQDHLDRHFSLGAYSQIKQKILKKTRIGLVGLHSLNPELLTHENIYHFEDLLDPIEEDISALINKDWPFHEIKNLKAVIAIYIAMENLNGRLDINNLKQSNLDQIKKNIFHLNSFERLPHRYEFMGVKKGIAFINDSKSTNLSSLSAALDSAKRQFGKRKVLLICGGDSKGQDFSKIPKRFLDSVKQLFIFGKDSQYILSKLKNKVECTIVKDLEQALIYARSSSKKGEVILLSPACSSTDMFSNYRERGEKFRKLAGFS